MPDIGTTTTCDDRSTLALTRTSRPRRGGGSGWLGYLARMVEAIETRRLLATMDDRMLADIGISRADALREAERRPWDLGRLDGGGGTAAPRDRGWP